MSSCKECIHHVVCAIYAPHFNDILAKGGNCSGFIHESKIKDIIHAQWEEVLDDFDDGNGERMYPHCSNCHRGVYRHDADRWCPFCGADMSDKMMRIKIKF